MIVNKIASAIYNDLVGGLQGIESSLNLSIEQLEDEVVEERMLILKTNSLKNILPKKDLCYALNCIPVDCDKSLDKCCDTNAKYQYKTQHFEIPQILNDFGEEAIDYIGSTDKQIKFKVYTDHGYRFHKYCKREKNKPYVYIDTTPNENNMYDCYLFNAPMLLRISVVAIFKDPRQVQQYSCCNLSEADNITWLASEVKKNILAKKFQYYRQYPTLPTQNDQTPK